MVYVVSFKKGNDKFEIELNPTHSQLYYKKNGETVKVTDTKPEFDSKALYARGKEVATAYKVSPASVKKSW